MAENRCCRKIIRDVIHILVKKLSAFGEESFFMSANRDETTTYLIGSKKGLEYMEGYTGVPKGFISFLKTESYFTNQTSSPSCQDVAFRVTTTTSSTPKLPTEKERGEVNKITNEDNSLNVPNTVSLETEQEYVNPASFETEESSLQDTRQIPSLGDESERETKTESVPNIVIAEVIGGFQNWDTADQPTQLKNDTNTLNNASSRRSDQRKNATVNSEESVIVRNTTDAKKNRKNGAVSRTTASVKVSNTGGTMSVPDSQNDLCSISSHDYSNNSDSNLESSAIDFVELEPDEILTTKTIENTAVQIIESVSPNQKTHNRHNRLRNGVPAAGSKVPTKRKTKKELPLKWFGSRKKKRNTACNAKLDIQTDESL